MFRYLHRVAVGAYWGVVLVAIVATPAYAGTVTITAETDVWLTVDADSTQVIVYGNSNRDCETPGADPFLWLYDDTGQLLLSDDDSNDGVGQCYSSKLLTTLDAGQYRVRAGYYPSQQGLGYEGGTYELVSDFTLSSTTTTTSTSTTTTTTSTTTTTTTTTSTTTTTTSTTTTTLPPTTTSTTTTTVPATTTLPPTTTTTLATTTTTSTTTTSTTTTTVPPTTTAAPTTTTTTTLAPTTTTSTTSTSTTTTSSSTTTTVVNRTTTTDPPTPTSTPPTPRNDAPESVKQEFEQQTDIYGTPGYDNYIPAGSTVSVQVRRTVTAASIVLGTVPTFSPARRRTR